MGADMPRTPAGSRTAVAVTAALVASLAIQPTDARAAATQVKPGFNVFSAQQDVEIGRQSAAQAERQMPILHDRATESYVQSVFDRLAAQAPGAKFPYQVRVV